MRSLRFRGSSALLVLLVPLFVGLTPSIDAQSPAENRTCSLCDATKRVKCSPCRGAGLVPVECKDCRGEGRRSCPICASFRDAKGQKKPGRMRCSNFCNFGKGTLLSRDGPPCKVCGANGSFDCKACDQGVVPCACGRAAVLEICRDCSGQGTFACPECEPRAKSAACLACMDTTEVPCPYCKTRSAPTSKCRRCCGSSSLICGGCFGMGRELCRMCRGEGKQTRIDNKIGFKKITCVGCSGAGYKKCDVCSSKRAGLVECPSCSTKSKDGCTYCSKKSIECASCRPSSAPALALKARLALDRDDFEAGLELYDKAVEAAEEAASQSRTVVRRDRGRPEPLDFDSPQQKRLEVQFRLAREANLIRYERNLLRSWLQ